MAVADMLGGASARIDGLTACLIGNETLDELLAVVERHLEANPARAQLKGDGVVAYALSIYRPCRESKSSFEERQLESGSPARCHSKRPGAWRASFKKTGGAPPHSARPAPLAAPRTKRSRLTAPGRLRGSRLA